MYLGPQGHTGTQAGFTAPAFGMRSNLAGGRFAQTVPQDQKNPLFGAFGSRAAETFLQVPQTPKNQ